MSGKTKTFAHYTSLVTFVDYMEPEIARRCKSCGAAIRARSAFCPQCGISLTEASAADVPASVSANNVPEEMQQTVAHSAPNVETVAPEAMAATMPATMEAPLNTEAPATEESPATGELRVENAAAAAPVLPVEDPPPANTVAPGVAPADALPEKRQPVTAAARNVVDESVRPRAEKLRRASNVVLDEAAADPSLRFVLVATALIILSLLLLLLGRIL
jgi:hypothetical protein